MGLLLIGIVAGSLFAMMVLMLITLSIRAAIVDVKRHREIRRIARFEAADTVPMIMPAATPC